MINYYKDDLRLLSFDTETDIQKGTLQKGSFSGWFKCKKTENDGSYKNPKNDVYTIILATDETKVSLYHNELGFKRKFTDEMKDKFNSCEIIIGQNIKFDFLYFFNDNFLPDLLINKNKLVWDVGLVHYILSAFRHIRPSLADLQEFWLGTKTKIDAISKLYARGKSAKDILRERYTRKRQFFCYEQYCLEDGKTPIKIYKKQLQLVKKYKIEPLIYVWNRYLIYSCLMEHTGLPVTKNKAIKIQTQLENQAIELEEKCIEIALQVWPKHEFAPKFNLNSSQMIANILFGGNLEFDAKIESDYVYKTGKKAGQKKLTKIKVTETVQPLCLKSEIDMFKKESEKGNVKTDKDTLSVILEKTKVEKVKSFCEKKLQINKIKKLLSTYINVFIEENINDRIRGDFILTATATGRPSCKKPNLFNLPKNGEYSAYVKQCIEAAPGWILVQLDKKQFEVACLAALSQDLQLIKDIQNEIDFHILRASYISKPYEELYDLIKNKQEKWAVELRKIGKIISFQKQYGAGVKALSARTGLEEDKIKEIFEAEDRRWPKVKDYNNRLKAEADVNFYYSQKKHIPAFMRQNKQDTKGLTRKFDGEYELTPIYDSSPYPKFKKEIKRKVYLISSFTGARYSLEEFGRRNKNGDIKLSYLPTQMVNYTVQGLAQIIKMLTNCSMLNYIYNNSDKVQTVNEVYDSDWLHVKKEHLDEVLSVLANKCGSGRNLIKKFFNYDTIVNFDVDCEIGYNMNEMKNYEIKKR